jgi:hypothetical protein
VLLRRRLITSAFTQLSCFVAQSCP